MGIEKGDPDRNGIREDIKRESYLCFTPIEIELSSFEDPTCSPTFYRQEIKAFSLICEVIVI